MPTWLPLRAMNCVIYFRVLFQDGFKIVCACVRCLQWARFSFCLWKIQLLEGSIYENTASRYVFLFHYFMPHQQSHNTGVLNVSLSNHSLNVHSGEKGTERKSEEKAQMAKENQSTEGSANHLFGLTKGKENFPHLMSPDLP